MEFNAGHIRRGLLVKTLLGEEDQTPPGTWGFVSDHNHSDHWDVVFPSNGAWVVITTSELLDSEQYKIMPAYDAAQAMQRIEELQQWLLDYDREQIDAPQGDHDQPRTPNGDDYNEIHYHVLQQLGRLLG